MRSGSEVWHMPSILFQNLLVSFLIIIVCYSSSLYLPKRNKISLTFQRQPMLCLKYRKIFAYLKNRLSEMRARPGWGWGVSRGFLKTALKILCRNRAFTTKSCFGGVNSWGGTSDLQFNLPLFLLTNYHSSGFTNLMSV